MSTNDDINLPPLPPPLHTSVTYTLATEYARAAVIADREQRAAKPEAERVYRKTVQLRENGELWVCSERLVVDEGHPRFLHAPTICWNKDRVWIDSEERREVAKQLRFAANNTIYDGLLARQCDTAADLLDGRKR